MRTPFDLASEPYQAALFDLDGVLTYTARIHAAAWKAMFDTYLEGRAREVSERFRPFEIATDYVQHVDGKPRLDGVRDFLGSRGIHLPEGSPEDPAGFSTVNGLGNAKNAMVRQAIEEGRVELDPAAITLIERLKEAGWKLAVVSSSRNTEAVLNAVGITDRFETRVDGVVAARLGLPGKPAPDTFLEAARQLGVAPGQAVVLEDATAGVAAGKAGHFGLVLGIDRENNPGRLVDAGADRVVSGLGDLLLAPGNPS